MERSTDNLEITHKITVSEDVEDYIFTRKGDFRVCTSCGGAIILPTSIKPSKPTDLRIPMGNQTLYVSRYQARGLQRIHKGMISVFFDY